MAAFSEEVLLQVKQGQLFRDHLYIFFDRNRVNFIYTSFLPECNAWKIINADAHEDRIFLSYEHINRQVSG